MIPFSEFSASREKREKPERKSIRVRFLISGTLWGMFFLSLGYVLFFSEETVIRDVSFVGNDVIAISDLETMVQTDTAGKYFRWFPKNNFFLFPRTMLIQDIRDMSPKIRSVTLRRIFPSQLVVTIEERLTVIVWRSGGSDFLLSEDGHVMNHPNLSSVLDVPFAFILWDEDGRNTQSGDAVTEEDIPSFVGEFTKKFESRFGKTLSHEVRATSRFSGELIFHVEGGFDIWLDSHRSIDDTLITLQAALDRGVPEEEREHLSRVDLRTANRVYYTVNSEVPAEVVPVEEVKQEVKASSDKKKK